MGKDPITWREHFLSYQDSFKTRYVLTDMSQCTCSQKGIQSTAYITALLPQQPLNSPQLLITLSSWYRGTSHVVCLLIITRKVSVSRRITAYSSPNNIWYQLYHYINSSHCSRPPNSLLKTYHHFNHRTTTTITTANTIVRHHPGVLTFGDLDSWQSRPTVEGAPLRSCPE